MEEEAKLGREAGGSLRVQQQYLVRGIGQIPLPV